MLRARNSVPGLQKSGNIMFLVDGTEVFITASLLNPKRAAVPITPKGSVSDYEDIFSVALESHIAQKTGFLSKTRPTPL